MKKLMPIKLYKPGIPTMRMAPNEQIPAPTAKIDNSIRVLTYRMRKVAINLLERNKDIATMLYVCAVALLIPKLSAYWMMKVHVMICAAT